MNLALRLRGPQCPALRLQAPWEGPFRGRPKVKVSPWSLAGTICRLWRAEARSKIRELTSGRVGPSVLALGAFEGHRGREGPAHSPALNDWRYPSGPGVGGAGRGGRVSPALRLGGPQSLAFGGSPFGRGPLGANLGLGLAPRRPAGSIHRLCGEWRGEPR